uniref:Uncharacterized protein n=1 Tax=Rhizophora mucronata TaxID=61149 RepID=A0A2P2K5Q5_RHIMU
MFKDTLVHMHTWRQRGAKHKNILSHQKKFICPHNQNSHHPSCTSLALLQLWTALLRRSSQFNAFNSFIK